MKPQSDARIQRGMEEMLRLRRERLSEGHKPIGWKIGFGSPSGLQRLQIDAPLIGFLTDRAIVASDANVPLAAWKKPALEPEIAVYMSSDLPGVPDRTTTQKAIASIGPAIELADMEFPPDDVEAILGVNIYNRHVILGPRDASRAGCVLDGLIGRVSHNSEQLPQVTEPQALTGDIVNVVSHLARTLSQFGETLRANDVIITGSITPPLWIKPGDTVRYTLDPIGTIGVRAS